MAKKKAKLQRKKTEARDAAFVEEYLANGRNGSAAYSKLHPKAKEPTCRVEAVRVLARPSVKTRLEKREKELLEKYQLTTDHVMRSLSQGLHFDPRKLYKPDGSLKAVSNLDDDTVMALAQVEEVEMAGGLKIDGESGPSHVPMYTKKVKWLDKNVVREQAMKHLGMFEKHNKQVTDPVRELMAAIDGRSKLAPPG